MMMQTENRLFVHLAHLLSYPERRMLEHVAHLQQALEDRPDVSRKVKLFSDYVTSTPMTAIEERFTNTFDMNPACCLEVGWHLFGEDYKRGEFLVHMRQALQEEELPESVELPDHLSHCLHLLAVLEDEDAQPFARRFLLPALEKILKSLDNENLYRNILLVLQGVLQERFGEADDGMVRSHRQGNSGRQLPVLNTF